MFIPKLQVQNFRNILDATVDLSDASFVVLRGKNFQGKSSIGQALSMCLTDTTESLDTAGKDFVRKIKRGEKKATIIVQVKGKHLIERTMTLNMNTTGRTSNSVCLDDPEFHPLPFDNFLKKYKDAIVIVCNTEFFNKLSEEKQKNLFAKLLLPERYDFPQDKVDAVNKAIGEGVVNFSGEPFAVINLAYKKLYDERTAVNRQVKDFVIPDPLPMVDGVDSYALNAQLEEIRSTRAKLQSDRDAAVVKANAIEVKRSGLQAKIDALLEKVDDGKQRLAVLEPRILTDEQVKAFTEVSLRSDKLALLTTQHDSLLSAIRTVNSSIERLNLIAEKDATCPTCDQCIDSVKIADMVSVLKEELAVTDKKIQELDIEIELLGDVQGAYEAIRNHETASKEYEEIKATILETVRIGKASREELNGLGIKVDATEPFAQPLYELTVKETNILDKLRPVIAAEERKAEIAKKTEMLAKLQAKAASIDSLVKYFDKDGIKSTLLAEHVGGFEMKLNNVLEAWGYKCHLSIEPYEFHVTTARGDTMPVSELSGAEQRMFLAALQCAVSIAANIGFVVVDEVDRLQPEIRSALNKNLYMMVQDGYLEQVVLIVADSSRDVPKLPRSAFFTITDGKVERLK